MENYLNAYREVASLSPENLPLHEKDDYFGISQTDFYSTLHMNDGVNERVVKEILTTREQIIFLVGPRGSGKTTTGLKTVIDLKAMNYMTQWITVSEHDANKYLDNRREILDFLRSQVTNFLLNEILKVRGNDPAETMNRLTTFLLCEDLSETKRPASFNEKFSRQRLRLQMFLRRNKIEYQQTLQDLSRPENLYDTTIKEIQQQILDMVELQHLCHAAMYFFDIRDIVVWIDNIDVFGQQDQVELIDAIFAINRSAPAHLRFVVAAREENVLRFDHFYDVQGAVRKSAVYMTDNINGNSLSGMYMPNLGFDRFSEIVRCRLEFARKFQTNIENKVRELLSEASEKSEANKIQAKTLEEKYLPKIPDIRKRYLDVLSEKTMKAIKGEKILHLLNNNIRSLLPLHAEFMTYLVNIGYDKQNVPYAFNYDDSFMKTQLLYWLCTVKGEAANEFRHFNIVRHSRNLLMAKTGQPKIACFLPFLTLSCIWNLCLRNRIHQKDVFQIPTIHDVVEQLGILECFDAEQVKSTIIDLYNPSAGGYTMFLAIESRQRLADVSQLKNDHRIRITYKGRAALASLCNSFGFLYAMLNIADNKVSRQNILDQKNIGKYFFYLLPDLKKIGRLHLNSLIQIRKRPAYVGKDNWLDLYLNDFGIPLESEYSRTHRACRGYGTSPKKVLYFDSLLHSIESYAKEGSSRQLRETIKNLITDYCVTLSKIEKGEITDIDDFEFGKS